MGAHELLKFMCNLKFDSKGSCAAKDLWVPLRGEKVRLLQFCSGLSIKLNASRTFVVNIMTSEKITMQNLYNKFNIRTFETHSRVL